MDERIMYKRSRVLREYVASFHLTTMFLGLGISAIGAYIVNSDISRTISILLLIVGVLITTTAFIGCFGAHIENTGLLNSYSSITAIALIIEFVIMGLLYSHKSELDYYGSSIWTFFGDNDARFLLDLEQSLKCCGYASTGDRAIPKTCSVLLGGIDIGCRESIVANIQAYRHWITAFLIVLFVTQFIALLVTVILSFIMDRETREEETYMALLSSQNNLHHHPSWLNGYSSESSFIINRNRSSQRSIPKYGSTPSN